MELRHLRYFVAVAEELHFGHAADRLGISEPPLSKQIRDLEREVGTPLLKRTSRRVELTPAGAALLLEAQAVLSGAEQAIDTARRTGDGQVGRLGIGTLSATAGWYLPEAARKFHERSPAVELYFEELSRSRWEHVRALQTRRIDLAIVRLPPAAADITSQVIAEEAMVAVLPAQHSLASQERVSLKELLVEPFVGADPHDEATQAFWDHVLGGQPQAIFSANVGTITLLGLVAAGFGVTLLPESVRAFARHDVVYRLVDPAPHLPVRVAWRTNDLSPPAQQFLEILQATASSLAS